MHDEANMLDGLFESMTRLPILARFAIALTLILTVPALCQRIRLPAVVGFLLAGVVFGPSGPDTAELLRVEMDGGPM